MKGLVAIFFVLATGPLHAQDPCLLMSEVKEKIFIPLTLSPGKSDAKFEETKPIQEAIEAFIKSHADWRLSEIEVISSSSNTPIMKVISVKDSKEILRVNQENKILNKNLADVRLNFVKSRMRDLKAKNLQLSSIDVNYSAVVLGASFSYSLDPREHDQNLKFVVPEFSKDYESRVEKIFQANKEDYRKVGIDNVDQFKDQQLYKSLYDVKFKAFQGFTIFIKGQKKSGVNCNQKIIDPAASGASTKQ